MCNYFSCVLSRETMFGLGEKIKVYYDQNTSSHCNIIDMNKLQDKTLKDRKIIRFEVIPLVSVFSKNKADWKLSVDEEGTLPVWYEDKMEKYNNYVWDAWADMVDKVSVALPDGVIVDGCMTMLDRISALNKILNSDDIDTYELQSSIREINEVFRKANIEFKKYVGDKGFDALTQGHGVSMMHSLNTPEMAELRAESNRLLSEMEQCVEKNLKALQ